MLNDISRDRNFKANTSDSLLHIRNITTCTYSLLQCTRKVPSLFSSKSGKKDLSSYLGYGGDDCIKLAQYSQRCATVGADKNEIDGGWAYLAALGDHVRSIQITGAVILQNHLSCEWYGGRAERARKLHRLATDNVEAAGE